MLYMQLVLEFEGFLDFIFEKIYERIMSFL
jgi:hypothetical protein